MKWAVLSDIHGNLQAFEAVLSHMDDQGVNKIISAGDIVGYGPNSQACLSRLYQIIGKDDWKNNCKGNNDKYLHSNTWENLPSLNARESLRWANGEVTNEGKRWLEQLSEKPVIRGDLFTVVHGTLMDSVGEFTYMYDNPQNIKDSFLELTTPIGIYGHTHRPAIYKAIPKPPPHILKYDTVIPKELGKNTSQDSIEINEYSFADDLSENKKLLVCAGSIGQPRDGDNRAAYMVIDDGRKVFQFFRIPYDIEATIAALTELEKKYPDAKAIVEKTKARLRVGN